MMKTMSFRRAIYGLIVLAAAAVSAHACSIPVFRYALERWELSPYEILVFSKGPLDADERAWLDRSGKGPPSGNFRIEAIDVTKDVPKRYKAFFDAHAKNQTLPWAAARLNDADAKEPPAWSGPYERKSLSALLASPVRSRIVDKLKAGETAVFLILQSGDEAADKSAHDLLARELARLEKSVKLPTPSDEGPQIRTAVPLKVSFAIMPLRRDDPAEQEFVKIVMSTEEDLDQAKGPIVLPVFGRGRLLCSMFGDDINATQLANVGKFLCGECSCQVKELNPGVDLLIAADWHSILDQAGPAANPRPDTPAPKRKIK